MASSEGSFSGDETFSAGWLSLSLAIDAQRPIVHILELRKIAIIFGSGLMHEIDDDDDESGNEAKNL